MEQWMNYAEQIRQETGLPIICVQTSRVSVDQLLLEHQERGWELSAITEDDSGAVWLIFIESLSWHESARALLRLFFTPQATRTGGSVINQVSAWLHSICHGSPISPPARLEQLWSWREPRAVFLMEHSRWESVFEWQTLQPLLQDFFKGEDSSFLESRLVAPIICFSSPSPSLEIKTIRKIYWSGHPGCMISFRPSRWSMSAFW